MNKASVTPITDPFDVKPAGIKKPHIRKHGKAILSALDGAAADRPAPSSHKPPAQQMSFDHRGIAARGWDEIGQLQCDFLTSRGLKPENTLLDIGCGALRAGRKLIAYLEPEHYYGIDSNKQLLDAGHQIELKMLGLESRCPRKNLFRSEFFRHGRLEPESIEFGICSSVLPYLHINYLRICLENVKQYFKRGGNLYLSFFEIPSLRVFSQRYTNISRFATHGLHPPYHYYRRDLIMAAEDTGWSCQYLGGWEHPDGEMMMMYTKL